ncbi:MAG TPA: glycosyltransferase family 2 protein [Elusimicrobiales bacterium]|nr:glycosyltransferase family 2 protein [Elusimicrobiales bacterium]
MKTIVVLPAYNAALTLEKTIADLPKGCAEHIILVDDASKDGTADLAEKLGLEVIRRPTNGGYGANQKTCYRAALKAGADIVVMIHPDYQYNPRLAPFMTGLIKENICDIVLGNRIRTRREALEGGMPLYKYISNRGLTLVENIITGQNLGEWHSGLRAYSRKVLETLNWERNSDDFVFDAQFLVQAAAAGMRIGDVPVQTKYFEEASSINFRRSTEYGLGSLYLLGRYLLHKWGLFKYALLETK